MQLENAESALKDFAVKLRLILLARRAILFAVIWLFLGGTATLVLRMTTRLATGLPAAVLAGVLLPLLLAAWLCDRRRLPKAPALRALFDSANECGGLFMAAGEAQVDPAWLQALPGLNPPRIAWRWPGAAGLLLAAAVFAAFSVLCPIPDLGLRPPSPLELKTAVEDLKANVEQLADKTVIEPNKAVEIKEELAKLEKEATGEDPAKAWEALDVIKESLTEAARDALEKNMAEGQAISDTLALADQAQELQQANGDQAMLSDLLREIGNMVNSQELSAFLVDKLPPGLLDAAANGQLTPEQLKMLSQCLQGCLGQCRTNLLDLANLKFIQGDFQLSNGECSGDGTNALLALLGQGLCNGNDNGALDGGLPGRGGIDRGRGDAPITWQNDTSEAGAGFKEQALPPSFKLDPKNNILTGISRSDPTAPVKKNPVETGTLVTGEGGSDSQSQTILPRHRGAIRRFFERAEKTE